MGRTMQKILPKSDILQWESIGTRQTPAYFGLAYHCSCLQHITVSLSSSHTSIARGEFDTLRRFTMDIFKRKLFCLLNCLLLCRRSSINLVQLFLL